MSRVEEIERAILTLDPDDFAQLVGWISELQQDRWDEQMDHDAAAGRLEFLKQEAETERRLETLHDWPDPTR